MAIGISVEFCIHLTVAFMNTAGSRDFRIATAMVSVGSSVVSGITLTKASGVIVLAFASSQMFEIYYFRVTKANNKQTAAARRQSCSSSLLFVAVIRASPHLCWCLFLVRVCCVH